MQSISYSSRRVIFPARVKCYPALPREQHRCSYAAWVAEQAPGEDPPVSASAEQEGRVLGPCPAATTEVGLSALPVSLNPCSIEHISVVYSFVKCRA